MSSLGNRVIVYALDKGFTVTDDGEVLDPDGKRMKAPANSTGYRTLTLVHPYYKRGYSSVLVHRLAAAYFFGEQVLGKQCVRHLDDDRLNNHRSNLQPGTFKENRGDIPKEKLTALGKKHAHLLVERSRKLTDKDVLAMRYHRSMTGLAYAKLAKMFNVSTMAAYRCCVGESWNGS